MDLRVYVDGVARIICDLTRTTTVHDIIIALAQYKGQAGRYSLLERAPDGKERTLSPNEFTSELLHHPDWSYVLRQNPSALDVSHDPKRSKSLDERKTPVLQQQQQPPPPEIPTAVTSSLSSSSVSSTSGQLRTVIPRPTNGFGTFSSTKSSEEKNKKKKKHTPINHLFPSANINSNNNNNNNNNNHLNGTYDGTPSSSISYFVDQKRSSRAPIQIIEQDLGVLDNQHEQLNSYRRSRAKSLLPLSTCEKSAFHLVRNPSSSSASVQQQQYVALLKMLKSQEMQVEQQQHELHEKQKEIDFREKQLQPPEFDYQHHPSYPDVSVNHELDREREHQKQLNTNYDHLQQQLKRCSASLEKKRSAQEQIQLNIEQTHHDIENLQATNKTNQKDINQYQHDLDCCNTTFNQQEDLAYILSQRNDDIDRAIQQRRQQINELENELIKLDDVLITTLIHPSHQFQSKSSTPSHYTSCPSAAHPSSIVNTSHAVLQPVRLQFVNSTLWKLCPSGIWV